MYRILAEDFNGDGLTDLLLLGNDFDAEVETYRQDASSGSLLLGDGRGGFRFLPNRFSGIWADGAVRDAVWARLESGKNVLILSNNNDQIRAFGGK